MRKESSCDIRSQRFTFFRLHSIFIYPGIKTLKMPEVFREISINRLIRIEGGSRSMEIMFWLVELNKELVSLPYLRRQSMTLHSLFYWTFGILQL